MASLAPYIFNQYFDDDGSPLSGGLVYAYEAGTALATPKDTFTSAAGTVANANPIVLDANGRKPVFLEEGAYDFVIKNAAGVTIDQQLGVSGGGVGGNASLQAVDSIASLKALAAGSSAYVDVGGHFSTGGGGSGRYYWDASSNASDNGGTIITPNSAPGTGRWKRLESARVDAQVFGGLISAILDIGAVELTLVISTPYTLAANLTIPSNISVEILKAAPISLGGFALTLGSQPIAGDYQIFAGAGEVIFNSAKYVRPEWWGSPKDDSEDDAPAIMKAIAAVQSVAGVTTIMLSGKYFIRQPIIFTRPPSGEYRFEFRGAGQRKAWVQVSDSVDVGAPLAAMFQYDNAGGQMEDLVFERFHLVGNNRANYGIDCGALHCPDLKYLYLRVSGTKVAALASAAWDTTYQGCTIRNNFGDGILCVLNENNATKIISCGIFANDGVGVNYKGGHSLSITGACTIEENKKCGVLIGGPARAVVLQGTYFEDNGATGYVLNEDAPRTIRADVIVNGGSLVNLSTAFPSFAFNAIGNHHNALNPIEYAYYIPGLCGGRIDQNHYNAPAGNQLKLVGFYGDTNYSRPQDITIGRNYGFASICRIDYNTLAGGTFTVGQYVGREVAGSFVALGKVLADDGSGVMYVQSQNKSESADRFISGGALRSATLSGSTFTAGGVTATTAAVSYRKKSAWVDGGVIANRRQLTGAFIEDALERRNFWDIPLDIAVWDSATAGSPLAIPFTASNGGADTIQMDSSELEDGDRIKITRDDGLSDKGVTNSATYYAIVVDGSNIKIALTEAAAIAGTPIVDITGDIGTGSIEPFNGQITEESDDFMGLPTYKISRKLKNQANSGRVRYTIDLDSANYERLRGRMVYMGAWVKQSHTGMAVRFTANGVVSRGLDEFSTDTAWKWDEWYAELPYSGSVNFLINFVAPGDGDTTNYELLVSNPIISLVGVPYWEYAENVGGILSRLDATSIVATDAQKRLVSQESIGTGKVVRETSPTGLGTWDLPIVNANRMNVGGAVDNASWAHSVLGAIVNSGGSITNYGVGVPGSGTYERMRMRHDGSVAATIVETAGGTVRPYQIIMGGVVQLQILNGGPRILQGSGTPESAVSAPVGSIFLRSDGGAGTSFYVKESGTGNTGWAAK